MSKIEVRIVESRWLHFQKENENELQSMVTLEEIFNDDNNVVKRAYFEGAKMALVVINQLRLMGEGAAIQYMAQLQRELTE